MLKKYLKGSKSKVLATIIILTAVLGYGTYLLIRHYHNPDTTPTAPSGVKLVPATNQEKKESEQNKDNIVQQQSQNQNSQNQPSSTTKKQVTVTITGANTSSVKAYVTGVFEDGGTCTATFTQGSNIVARTSTGFANVSYTQCSQITPNLPTGGTWSVVVSYTSVAAVGTSQAQTF